jgi:hypothetical protein
VTFTAISLCLHFVSFFLENSALHTALISAFTSSSVDVDVNVKLDVEAAVAPPLREPLLAVKFWPRSCSCASYCWV